MSAAISATSQLRWAVSDALVVARRNLTHIVRLPQLLVFSTVQPVLFVLMFAYVFGGAIRTPGMNYIDYLLPGIFIQTVAFGSMQTGIGLADDLSKGLIDRFRSLPMARSAVLAGRTLSDAVRSLFVILLMFAVGSLIGFRVGTGPLQAMAALGVALAFGFALSWIGATIGLAAGTPEAVQAGGFVWLFPLVFASSAFVPTESMPGWLQAFAEHQPVTATVDALRALLVGGPATDPVLASLAWSAAILALFMPLAVGRYRRS
ncbi:MAG TPA: ABC transporter permease [Egibacteraceae bacterium]|nr:ABC transporter permease [Egibacteraceae bacterium]